MKEVVVVVLSVVAVLIVLGFLGIRAIIAKFNKADKTLQAFVDMAIPDILKNQNIETWEKYAGPELMSLANSSEWKHGRKMKNLGDFQDYDGSESRGVISDILWSTLIGRYVAMATFYSGPARIYITACRKKKTCYLASFRIRSKARPKGLTVEQSQPDAPDEI